MVPTPGKTRIKVLSINEPIICAGVRVRQGDIIVGDGTGVLCLPIEHVEKITEEAEKFTADDKKAMKEMENLCKDRFERFGTSGNASKITVKSMDEMAKQYNSGELNPKTFN